MLVYLVVSMLLNAWFLDWLPLSVLVYVDVLVYLVINLLLNAWFLDWLPLSVLVYIVVSCRQHVVKCLVPRLVASFCSGLH